MVPLAPPGSCQVCFGQDVTRRSGAQLAMRCTRRQVEGRIKRQELENVTMRLAGWRIRPRVADFVQIVVSLDGSVQKHRFGWDTFLQLARLGGDVEDDPVREGSLGSVRIDADQSQ